MFYHLFSFLCTYPQFNPQFFFFTSSLNLKIFRRIDFMFLIKYRSDSSDRLSFSHYTWYMTVTLGFSLHCHSGLTFSTLLDSSSVLSLVFQVFVLISCFSEVSKYHCRVIWLGSLVRETLMSLLLVFSSWAGQIRLVHSSVWRMKL